MSEHFFLDGYGVESSELSSVDNMEKLLDVVNKKYCNDSFNNNFTLLFSKDNYLS